MRSPVKFFTNPKQMVQILQPLQIVSNFHNLKCKDNLHHDDGKPKTGTKTLHHHVGRDLSSNIERKEDSQSDIVFDRARTLGGHVQIFLEVEEFGISDVCAVEEGEACTFVNTCYMCE